MNSFIKRALTIIVASTMSVSFAACKGGENNVRIGSTYNTLKILQDDMNYPDLGQKLSISMAKGETEGAQLIVTPQKNVASYSIEVSDLTGEGGATISKDNVEIFVQKYLEVKAKSNKQNNTDYQPGWYPDMLLPIDLARDQGEDTIEGGKNQAFTVEVSTTSETEAGDYIGTLTLELDGKTETLPLSVTVWDIDITQSYGQTSFNWFLSGMMMGETEFTYDRYKNYYDKMLTEYKTCLTKIPGSYSPQLMAENVLAYWDNPSFTSYCIPGDFTLNGQFNSGRFLDYLYELAQLSEPGKILLERAHVYNIDEPNTNAYGKIDQVREAIYWCEDELVLRLESEGYFDRFDAQYKEDFVYAATHIPQVIPVASTEPVSALGARVNTYCAVIDQLDTERYRDIYHGYAEQTADRGGELWYYTCVQPLYPYPTHHIDDALIGSRIMRWMQKSYDLEGYLYWSVGAYKQLIGGSWVWTDPYGDPVRYNNGGSGTMGDGYLIYPGKKYGVDDFLPSVRLTTLRDSQEDLNMLYVLENMMEEYGAFYGLNEGYFDMDDMVQNIYDALFTGTRYEKDDANFYAQREALAEIILELKNDYKFAYKREIDGAKASVEIFLADGYTLKVDGADISPAGDAGGGNRFEISRTLDQKTSLSVEVLKSGDVVGTHEIFVGDQTKILDLLEESITVSEGSEKTYADGALTVKFVSRGSTATEKADFNPAVFLPETLFGSSWKTIGNITFTVANTEDFDINVYVRLQSGVRTYDIKDAVSVPANGEVTFTVSKVGENAFSTTKDVNIEFYLDNVDADKELLPDRTLIIKNITFSTVM